jgi:hypothetical protein
MKKSEYKEELSICKMRIQVLEEALLLVQEERDALQKRLANCEADRAMDDYTMKAHEATDFISMVIKRLRNV